MKLLSSVTSAVLALTLFLTVARVSATHEADIAAIPVPELTETRDYVNKRVAEYKEEWTSKLPETVAGNEAGYWLSVYFAGNLADMRRYLIAKAPLGHYGWEKEALEAFRGSIFQTPTCAPSAFPGAEGFGKNALRCTHRDPHLRPVTNLDHRGANAGDPTGKCTHGGDSIGMQPGGFLCELTGAMVDVHADSAGIRLVWPDVVGTRGIVSYGAGSRVSDGLGDNPLGDSLIYLGRAPGMSATERYDMRVPSFLTTNAQTGMNVYGSNIIWAHSTTWDQQCNGPNGDCSPSEGKAFRICESESDTLGTDVYFVHNDFHGNSGDDVLTFGCSNSTFSRNFVGPVQRGGTQTSCLTGGGSSYERGAVDTIAGANVTYAWSLCNQAGHRPPLYAKNIGEVVNWVATGWDNRNFETSPAGDKCCTWNYFRSIVLAKGKATGGTRKGKWWVTRVNATHNSTQLEIGQILADSGVFHLKVDWMAIDTTHGDGFQIDACTTGAGCNNEQSFWDADRAVCDRTSALGGDTSFPCTDTHGNTIDSTTFDFQANITGSDIEVLQPDSVWTRVVVNKEIGNRFVMACSGALLTSQGHNAFADDQLDREVTQVWPSAIPNGSFPDSMQHWNADYPTGTGMAADSTGSTFTPCARNPNGVPDAMADTLVALYGGTADNVDWGWDDASTGYELWRWLIQPDSLDAVLLQGSGGGGGSATFTYVRGLDSLSVLWVPLDSIFGTIWVDTSAVPVTTPAAICPQANATDADSALVSVARGNENGQTVYDSTEVDSIFANHGAFEGCSLRTLREFNPG